MLGIDKAPRRQAAILPLFVSGLKIRDVLQHRKREYKRSAAWTPRLLCCRAATRIIPNS